MSKKKITVIVALSLCAGVVPLWCEDVLPPQARAPSEGTPGCLSRHEGIEIINDTMQPWELPVGYGTPVILAGERGVYRRAEQEYLVTSRGNAQGNWLREGDRAYLISYYTEMKHEIPFLKIQEMFKRFSP